MDTTRPFSSRSARRRVCSTRLTAIRQRLAKLQMKIAGGFHMRAGAERFARMRDLVETARHREWNRLNLLRRDPDATMRKLLLILNAVIRD